MSAVSEPARIHCYLLMADIVGYSKEPEETALGYVKDLLQFWRGAEEKFHDASLNQRSTVIPIGDGLIVVIPELTSDNYWPIESFLDFIAEVSRPAAKFKLHLGLHYGPCRPVRIEHASVNLEPGAGSKDWNNFLGYHMNYLARVTACAGPDQVIASESFVERLNEYLKPDDAVRMYPFTAEFKEDLICITETHIEIVSPRGRIVGPEKRTVYCLFGKRDGEREFGKPSPPLHAIRYIRSPQRTERAIHLSEYQLLPQPELYSMYRGEEDIMRNNDPLLPFRAPFGVCFAPTILNGTTQPAWPDIHQDPDPARASLSSGDFQIQSALASRLFKIDENNQLWFFSVWSG